MPSITFSDEALAIFAFAAYHQLASGEPVVDVVLEDGAGHAADPKAVSELQTGGFIETAGGRAAFTETGRSKIAAVVAALRSA